MRGSTRIAALWWPAAAALSFFLASCGASTAFYREVDEDVGRGAYDRAIASVWENRSAYGDKSTVLFHLDLGMLHHYAGNFDSSSHHFFIAERQIEDLYTKSVSLTALSYVLNDNVTPYEGEDFEKVLINVFLALNYAQQGMTDDALVEARKVDAKLRQYTREYDGKNKYKEDAFIRYLAGALYEQGGEINDAFISYRNAFETYKTYEKEYGTPAPSFLLDDLVRTATLLSFSEEAEEYRSLGGRPFTSDERELGTLLVLTYTGRGPIKEEVRPTVSIPDSTGTLHTFQVALPKFVPRFHGERSYLISAVGPGDSAATRTGVAENITSIADASLNDRLTMIYLKSGGRALLKFLAAEKAKSEMTKEGEKKTRNFLASLAVDLLVGATEQADTRSWRTLPAQIQLAQARLKPGTYDVAIVSDNGGFERTRVAKIEKGKVAILLVDDIR